MYSGGCSPNPTALVLSVGEEKKGQCLAAQTSPEFRGLGLRSSTRFKVTDEH